jgi:hypothetical protein
MAVNAVIIPGIKQKNPLDFSSKKRLDSEYVLKQLRSHRDNGGSVSEFFVDLRKNIQGSSSTSNRRDSLTLVVDLISLMQRDHSAFKGQVDDIVPQIAIAFKDILTLDALTKKDFLGNKTLLQKFLQKSLKGDIKNYDSLNNADKESIRVQFSAITKLFCSITAGGLRKTADTVGKGTSEQLLTTIANTLMAFESAVSNENSESNLNTVLRLETKRSFVKVIDSFNLGAGNKFDDFRNKLSSEPASLAIKKFLNDVSDAKSTTVANTSSGIKITNNENLRLLIKGFFNNNWNSLIPKFYNKLSSKVSLYERVTFQNKTKPALTDVQTDANRGRAFILGLYELDKLTLVSTDAAKKDRNLIKDEIESILNLTSAEIKQELGEVGIDFKKGLLKELLGAIKTESSDEQVKNLRQLFAKYDIFVGENSVTPELRTLQSSKALRYGTLTSSQSLRLGVTFDFDALAKKISGSATSLASNLTSPDHKKQLEIVKQSNTVLVGHLVSQLNVLNSVAERPVTVSDALVKVREFMISNNEKGELRFPGLEDIPEKIDGLLLYLRNNSADDSPFTLALNKFEPAAANLNFTVKPFLGHAKSEGAKLAEYKLACTGTVADVLKRSNLTNPVFKVGNKVLELPKEGERHVHFSDWVALANSDASGPILPLLDGTGSLEILGDSEENVSLDMTKADDGSVVSSSISLETTFETLFSKKDKNSNVASLRVVLKNGTMIDFSQDSKAPEWSFNGMRSNVNFVKGTIVNGENKGNVVEIPKSTTLSKLTFEHALSAMNVSLSDVMINGLIQISKTDDSTVETKRWVTVVSPEGSSSQIRLAKDVTLDAFKADIKSQLNVVDTDYVYSYSDSFVEPGDNNLFKAITESAVPITITVALKPVLKPVVATGFRFPTFFKSAVVTPDTFIPETEKVSIQISNGDNNPSESRVLGNATLNEFVQRELASDDNASKLVLTFKASDGTQATYPVTFDEANQSKQLLTLISDYKLVDASRTAHKLVGIEIVTEQLENAIAVSGEVLVTSKPVVFETGNTVVDLTAKFKVAYSKENKVLLTNVTVEFKDKDGEVLTGSTTVDRSKLPLSAEVSVKSEIEATVNKTSQPLSLNQTTASLFQSSGSDKPEVIYTEYIVTTAEGTVKQIRIRKSSDLFNTDLYTVFSNEGVLNATNIEIKSFDGQSFYNEFYSPIEEYSDESINQAVLSLRPSELALHKNEIITGVKFLINKMQDQHFISEVVCDLYNRSKEPDLKLVAKEMVLRLNNLTDMPVLLRGRLNSEFWEGLAKQFFIHDIDMLTLSDVISTNLLTERVAFSLTFGSGNRLDKFNSFLGDTNGFYKNQAFLFNEKLVEKFKIAVRKSYENADTFLLGTEKATLHGMASNISSADDIKFQAMVHQLMSGKSKVDYDIAIFEKAKKEVVGVAFGGNSANMPAEKQKAMTANLQALKAKYLASTPEKQSEIRIFIERVYSNSATIFQVLDEDSTGITSNNISSLDLNNTTDQLTLVKYHLENPMVKLNADQKETVSNVIKAAFGTTEISGVTAILLKEINSLFERGEFDILIQKDIISAKGENTSLVTNKVDLFYKALTSSSNIASILGGLGLQSNSGLRSNIEVIIAKALLSSSKLTFNDKQDTLSFDVVKPHLETIIKARLSTILGRSIAETASLEASNLNNEVLKQETIVSRLDTQVAQLGKLKTVLDTLTSNRTSQVDAVIKVITSKSDLETKKRQADFKKLTEAVYDQLWKESNVLVRNLYIAGEYRDKLLVLAPKIAQAYILTGSCSEKSFEDIGTSKDRLATSTDALVKRLDAISQATPKIEIANLDGLNLFNDGQPFTLQQLNAVIAAPADKKVIYRVDRISGNPLISTTGIDQLASTYVTEALSDDNKDLVLGTDVIVTGYDVVSETVSDNRLTIEGYTDQKTVLEDRIVTTQGDKPPFNLTAKAVPVSQSIAATYNGLKSVFEATSSILGSTSSIADIEAFSDEADDHDNVDSWIAEQTTLLQEHKTLLLAASNAVSSVSQPSIHNVIEASKEGRTALEMQLNEDMAHLPLSRGTVYGVDTKGSVSGSNASVQVSRSTLSTYSVLQSENGQSVASLIPSLLASGGQELRFNIGTETIPLSQLPVTAKFSVVDGKLFYHESSSWTVSKQEVQGLNILSGNVTFSSDNKVMNLFKTSLEGAPVLAKDLVQKELFRKIYESKFELLINYNNDTPPLTVTTVNNVNSIRQKEGKFEVRGTTGEWKPVSSIQQVVSTSKQSSSVTLDDLNAKFKDKLVINGAELRDYYQQLSEFNGYSRYSATMIIDSQTIKNTDQFKIVGNELQIEQKDENGDNSFKAVDLSNILVKFSHNRALNYSPSISLMEPVKDVPEDKGNSVDKKSGAMHTQLIDLKKVETVKSHIREQANKVRFGINVKVVVVDSKGSAVHVSLESLTSAQLPKIKLIYVQDGTDVADLSKFDVAKNITSLLGMGDIVTRSRDISYTDTDVKTQTVRSATQSIPLKENGVVAGQYEHFNELDIRTSLNLHTSNFSRAVSPIASSLNGMTRTYETSGVETTKATDIKRMILDRDHRLNGVLKVAPSVEATLDNIETIRVQAKTNLTTYSYSDLFPGDAPTPESTAAANVAAYDMAQSGSRVLATVTGVNEKKSVSSNQISDVQTVLAGLIGSAVDEESIKSVITDYLNSSSIFTAVDSGNRPADFQYELATKSTYRELSDKKIKSESKLLRASILLSKEYASKLNDYIVSQSKLGISVSSVNMPSLSTEGTLQERYDTYIQELESQMSGLIPFDNTSQKLLVVKLKGDVSDLAVPVETAKAAYKAELLSFVRHEYAAISKLEAKVSTAVKESLETGEMNSSVAIENSDKLTTYVEQLYTYSNSWVSLPNAYLENALKASENLSGSDRYFNQAVESKVAQLLSDNKLSEALRFLKFTYKTLEMPKSLTTMVNDYIRGVDVETKLDDSLYSKVLSMLSEDGIDSLLSADSDLLIEDIQQKVSPRSLISHHSWKNAIRSYQGATWAWNNPVTTIGVIGLTVGTAYVASSYYFSATNVLDGTADVSTILNTAGNQLLRDVYSLDLNNVVQRIAKFSIDDYPLTNFLSDNSYTASKVVEQASAIVESATCVAREYYSLPQCDISTVVSDNVPALIQVTEPLKAVVDTALKSIPKSPIAPFSALSEAPIVNTSNKIVLGAINGVIEASTVAMSQVSTYVEALPFESRHFSALNQDFSQKVFVETMKSAIESSKFPKIITTSDAASFVSTKFTEHSGILKAISGMEIQEAVNFLKANFSITA